MKLFVKVKPGSKEEKIKKIDKNNFVVKIYQKAEKGRANKAVIEIISKYFDIPKSRIKIKSGLTSRRKIIEIL
ncbi:DUF167 domain-containing protein [bacterium]|nr:DUF167 domain-containing protein [bacterium]